MGKYLDIPFPTVKNPFDGHIHMHRWYFKETDTDFTHGLEEYRRVCGLKYIALASLPSGNPIPAPRDVSNNIMCAFYKLLNENTFAYGGFIYPSYPAKAEEMENMSLLTQLDELNEIGFDGIKMLEGKPNLYERVGQPLDSDFFEAAFEKMEKNGTYILMHAIDPESFWASPTEENIKKGWCYGDSSKYPTSETLYNQIDNILAKHPKLNLCLAHFFFCSEKPERVAKMLDTYENLAIDITPGGEMYIGFNKNPEYFHQMAPYALALGVDARFARQFGGRLIDPCPYIAAGTNSAMHAAQWCRLMRRVLRSMEARYQRSTIEKITYFFHAFFRT